MRSFLMTTKGLSEDEAISLMSVGVDFGVTQVVDGNWGIHAIIKKSLFAGMRRRDAVKSRPGVGGGCGSLLVRAQECKCGEL